MRKFLAIAIAVACSGCALTVDREDLAYVPPATSVTVTGSGTVNVEVTDHRPGDQSQIGSKKNGYGMEMAAIISNRNISDLVHDAIASELQRRGFIVGPSRLVVSADIVRFRSNYEVGFFSADAKADATIAVQVTAPNGSIVYARTVSGEGAELNNVMMGGLNTKLALEKALPDAMSKLMSDQHFIAALTSTSALTN